MTHRISQVRAFFRGYPVYGRMERLGWWITGQIAKWRRRMPRWIA